MTEPKDDNPPVQVSKKAIDVKPHYYGIWCTVGDSKPLVNAIVSRRWSEDGKHIWFMLDTHNFSKHEAEEEIQVVKLNPQASDSTKEMWEKYDLKFMGDRPLSPVVIDSVLDKYIESEGCFLVSKVWSSVYQFVQERGLPESYQKLLFQRLFQEIMG